VRLLAASWVVPVTAPPIRDGRVAVDAGRIVWVGRPGDPGEPEGSVRDLGAGVLMPGLVNAHCHLELTGLRGALAAYLDGPHRGSRFVPWVREMLRARGRLEPAAAREATRQGIEELGSTGTVAVGDVSNELGHLDLLDESGLDAVVFYELIGWDPARADQVLALAEGRVDQVREERVEVRLAAHAPYSVSAALFALLVSRGGPASVHLAESPEETRFLRDGGGELAAFLEERVGRVAFDPPGTSPVRYLDSLGALRPGVVAAHCVQVDPEDRALLAERGGHVAVCPRSNRNLGIESAPVPEMLRAGVRLCLGTDSAASVGTLDLMQDVAALRREFPDLDPAVVVRMATAGGAEALGFRELGSLEPGKRAALAFASADGAPLTEPLEFLASGEARVRRVEA
jgi:cytosine/adenosine deaminase-related metal-dependent hydrolase